mmetsp:Transcript_30247/g.97286  ORF Transcript_30247/g.97286 Transcript_30247/m.97286 type:complete len:345 (-) Transcript_30247:160-1194(-)
MHSKPIFIPDEDVTLSELLGPPSIEIVNDSPDADCGIDENLSLLFPILQDNSLENNVSQKTGGECFEPNFSIVTEISMPIQQEYFQICNESDAQEESSVEAQESISSPPVTTHIENTTPILKYALPPRHDQQSVSVNLASLVSEPAKDVRSPAERKLEFEPKPFPSSSYKPIERPLAPAYPQVHHGMIQGGTMMSGDPMLVKKEKLPKSKRPPSLPKCAGNQPMYCTYEFCPNPTHTSGGSWKFVTAETRAGNRDWTQYIGRLFCNACFTQFATKGAMERLGRQGPADADLPSSPNKKRRKDSEPLYVFCSSLALSRDSSGIIPAVRLISASCRWLEWPISLRL